MKIIDLWSLVQKSDPSECWAWTGAKTRGGYGTFRGTTAHRVVFVQVYGPIPDGHVVMHICDNPICCNPGHLRVGTQKDNIADMHSKGRDGDKRVFGEKHGRSKLTDADVRCIRLLRSFCATQQKLADAFGVRQTHISRIVRGENRSVPTAA